MHRFALLIFFCIATGAAEGESFVESLAANVEKEGLLPNFAESWRSHIDSWRQHNDQNSSEESNETEPTPVAFNCDTNATAEEDDAAVPSVHRLLPQQIGIIGALGASIVAGTGADANRLLATTLQYRGVSFPIGGDGNLTNTVTLPNILKEYNPDIVGWSRSIAPAWFEALSRLNVAVPGAKAEDLDEQAREIVKRIGRIPGARGRAKLITIFVGMNDLCEACDKRFRGRASSYRRDIKSALDTLQDSLSHTVVNLIALPPMRQWYRQLHDDPVCWALHRYLCPCISNPKTDALAFEYNAELYALASRYRDPEFTVVVQPFMSGKVQFPKVRINDTEKTDQSFFAPDCFHFSRKGHAAAASALWTNLFQGIGEKSDTLNFSQSELSCPNTDCPYIRTWRNSENCSSAKITTISPVVENLTSEFSGSLENFTRVPAFLGNSSHQWWNFTSRPLQWWNFTRPSRWWNFTRPPRPDRWNATDDYGSNYFTLKPWHRAVINLAQAPGSASGYQYSAASAAWIAFGVILSLAVVATAIVGIVNLKKRLSRSGKADEHTPLLNTGSNVEQVY